MADSGVFDQEPNSAGDVVNAEGEFENYYCRGTAHPAAVGEMEPRHST